MTIRTQLKAGGISINHNEALQVRTTLKAGAAGLNNHNEALQVRSAIKAGGRRAGITTRCCRFALRSRPGAGHLFLTTTRRFRFGRPSRPVAAGGVHRF